MPMLSSFPLFLKTRKFVYQMWIFKTLIYESSYSRQLNVLVKIWSKVNFTIRVRDLLKTGTAVEPRRKRRITVMRCDGSIEWDNNSAFSQYEITKPTTSLISYILFNFLNHKLTNWHRMASFNWHLNLLSSIRFMYYYIFVLLYRWVGVLDWRFLILEILWCLGFLPPFAGCCRSWLRHLECYFHCRLYRARPRKRLSFLKASTFILLVSATTSVSFSSSQ